MLWSYKAGRSTFMPTVAFAYKLRQFEGRVCPTPAASINYQELETTVTGQPGIKQVAEAGLIGFQLGGKLGKWAAGQKSSDW